MKSEYTEAQRAAVSLYLWHQRRFQELDTQSEELLSEGNHTLRKEILKDVDRQRCRLEGMRDMAEAMGFSKAALLKAVREAAKENTSP